jgi:uncharacterized membrane protein YfhO
MAVEAPKGKHVVKFYYDKNKFLISLGLWILGVMMVIFTKLYTPKFL